MSGRWRTSAEGTLTGMSCGRVSAASSNRGRCRFARQPAGERGELMARLRELALEQRQRRLGLRGLRLLREHVGARHGAELELALHDGELTGPARR